MFIFWDPLLPKIPSAEIPPPPEAPPGSEIPSDPGSPSDRKPAP